MPLLRFTIPLIVFWSVGFPCLLSAQAPSANLAWDRLVAPEQKDALSRGGSPNWLTIAAEAEAFSRSFPADDRTLTARRIALCARIRAQDSEVTLPTTLRGEVEAYLTNRDHGPRDRIKLRIEWEQAKLRRISGRAESGFHQAKIRHARDLMQEFPGEPEGYGFLLALAKTADPSQARTLARELLKSSSPDRFKTGAERVLARLNLVGQTLRLEGAESVLAAAKRKQVVIYSWTAADTGFLQIIRRHAQTDNVAFIGVNLDTDFNAAKIIAGTLPGSQFFDGAGLEGPLARQLCLLFATSLYWVDEGGVVREVNGQNDPQGLLTRLVAGKGGAL